MTLLGFLENDSAFNELSDLLNHCQYNSWLKDVINHALENSSKNQWAKSWFEKFWASDNDVESWAAFRIFLRCVDRRYWIWKKNIVEKYINMENYEKKEMYLEINFKNIQEAIEKNEKDLKNTFLGRNISKGKLKFWM